MILHNEQDAIKQAIDEGAYKGEGARFNYLEATFNDVGWYRKDGYAENENLADVLQDPDFWQALGKARGWEKCEHKTDYMNHPFTWGYYALRYFETLMSKGDMQKFWESLP